MPIRIKQLFFDYPRNFRMTDRTELVAPCGIDCGICELFLADKNPQIKQYLISVGIPESVMPCPGCKASAGHCPIHPGECATYACSKQKKVDSCSECSQFPCEYLTPAAAGADKLPHNLKVYNLSIIKRDGPEAFTRISGDIKKRYFNGKMVIGKGPVIE